MSLIITCYSIFDSVHIVILSITLMSRGMGFPTKWRFDMCRRG